MPASIISDGDVLNTTGHFQLENNTNIFLSKYNENTYFKLRFFIGPGGIKLCQSQLTNNLG